jgi:hypothetical protein
MAAVAERPFEGDGGGAGASDSTVEKRSDSR